MLKKSALLYTLGIFSSFFLFCTSTQYQSLDTIHNYVGNKILSIQKTTGENINFVEASGIINGDSITVKKTIRKEINKEDIQLLTTLFHRIGQPYKYKLITKDGQQYDLRSYKELEDNLLWIETDEEMSIPLSEIQEIEIQKRDQIKGGIWGFGVGFLIGGNWEAFRIYARPPADRGTILGGIANAMVKSIGVGIIVHHIGAWISARDKYVLTAAVDSTRIDTEIPTDSVKQEIDIRKIRLF
ncbi:hypothetical protein JW824_09880 [bacterium]|nr:hypothetical protein [bacterium]RQV94396.1 MAG: hypothetical protein EH221_08075 [bacterium]